MNALSAPVIPAPAAPLVGPAPPAADAVAQRLWALAAEPALADRREQLEQLAETLAAPDHAGGWAKVPLHTALGFPIMAESGQSRLMKWLGGARVALVFVPVAVTWIGVAWAGQLYQRELARDPELGTQSFFRLWLTGFDGAMPSFHVMAVIIATAVVGIIGLTVWMAIDETHGSARRRALQASLHGALTEATVHLTRSEPQSPERFADALTRAAEGLTSLVARVHAATEAATGAMHGAAAATEAARDATTRTAEAASELAGSTGALGAAVERSQTATTQLITDAVARAEAVTSQLSSALTSEISRLTSAVATETGSLTRAVTTTTGGLTGTLEGLRQAVDALRAQQDQHLDTLGRQLGEDRDRLGRQLDEDRDRLGMRLAAHEEQVRQLLPELVDRIADAQLQALESHLTQLQDAIRQLAHQQQAVASAIARLRHRPTATAPPVPGGPPTGRVRAFLRRFLGD